MNSCPLLPEKKYDTLWGEQFCKKSCAPNIHILMSCILAGFGLFVLGRWDKDCAENNGPSSGVSGLVLLALRDFRIKSMMWRQLHLRCGQDKHEKAFFFR